MKTGMEWIGLCGSLGFVSMSWHTELVLWRKGLAGVDSRCASLLIIRDKFLPRFSVSVPLRNVVYSWERSACNLHESHDVDGADDEKSH